MPSVRLAPNKKRDTNGFLGRSCLGGTVHSMNMSGDGTTDPVSHLPVGEESATTIPMPTGCQCTVSQDVDDPDVFAWRYSTQCPVGPKDHKAVWRPAFKGVIESHLGLCWLPEGPGIIVDGGYVSAIPFPGTVEWCKWSVLTGFLLRQIDATTESWLAVANCAGAR